MHIAQCTCYGTNKFGLNKLLISFLQTNRFHLDKIICKPMPNQTAIVGSCCEVKYIERDVIKVDIWADLNKTLHDIWGQFVVFYKFNSLTYQKFPLAVKQNVCSWLAGNYTIPFIDSLMRIANEEYSNVYHPCPFEKGRYYFKNDHILLNEYVKGLLRSKMK